MTRSVTQRLLARLSPVKEADQGARRLETRERREALARRQAVARWLVGAFYAEREKNHFVPNVEAVLLTHGPPHHPKG